METMSLLAAIGLLLLLAITANRYGVDSREGFAAREREQEPRGIV